MRRSAVLAFLLATQAHACSAFTDLDGLAATAGTGNADAGGGPQGGAAAVGGSGGEGGGAPSCECVPEPPLGWTGPYRLTSIAGVGTLVCTDGQPATTYHTGPPPQHTCSSCVCGRASGGCTPNQLVCYTGTGCTGSPLDVTGSSGCMAAASSVQSCAVGASFFVGGACPASGGEVVATGWEESHHLCAAAPGALGRCGDGGTCGASDACIARADHAACPAEYPEQLLVWGDEADDRACTACECTDAVGTCNGGGYILESDLTFCLIAGNPVPSGGCKNFAQSTVYADVVDATLGAATCTPLEANPTGSFAPTEPATICCRSAP